MLIAQDGDAQLDALYAASIATYSDNPRNGFTDFDIFIALNTALQIPGVTAVELYEHYDGHNASAVVRSQAVDRSNLQKIADYFELKFKGASTIHIWYAVSDKTWMLFPRVLASKIPAEIEKVYFRDDHFPASFYSASEYQKLAAANP